MAKEFFGNDAQNRNIKDPSLCFSKTPPKSSLRGGL